MPYPRAVHAELGLEDLDGRNASRYDLPLSAPVTGRCLVVAAQ